MSEHFGDDCGANRGVSPFTLFSINNEQGRDQMVIKGYVHGYSNREEERLQDQANTLIDLLHHDTRYEAGSKVLEAGCGTGAQTVLLAGSSPEARFTSVDISEESIAQAEERVRAGGHVNVDFQTGDIYDLAFPDSFFDHVFVCFVLEHLSEPPRALAELQRVLKPGGTVTAIEGDHGSASFHPDSETAGKAIKCLVDLQAAAGGDSMIGRRLYPLLTEAGFADVTVSPRMVYVDWSRPDLVEGFTKNTFTAMVEGVRAKALDAGLIDEATFDSGIRDLYRTAEQDGTFCYTFFKGVGVKDAAKVL